MKDLMVMAQIAGRRCAIKACDVKSVIEIGAVAPVPGTPDHIAGITALRSQTLTVIDCRRALGLNPDDWELDHRAIVVSVQGHSYALKVDSVDDITTCVTEPDIVPGGFGAEWSRISAGLIETNAGPALLLNLGSLIDVGYDVGAAA